MTKEALAAQLNGREHTSEITPEEEKIAKRSGLLVIFGASDDLCELRGVTHDEVGAYNDTTVCITRDGDLLPEVEDDEEEVLKKHGALKVVKDKRDGAIRISALWCAEKGGPSWAYKTDEPHATFNVMEDGEVYCRGIVIDMGYYQ